MKFLIGPDQVYFSFERGLRIQIFKKVGIVSIHIRFESADPGIVTIQRIFNEF
jgi:hypothetical protein